MTTNPTRIIINIGTDGRPPVVGNVGLVPDFGFVVG
jgi:hypothetical protein